MAAFELQIANRRETAKRFGTSRWAGTFLPASCIKLEGELNERSVTSLLERLDGELKAGSKAVLVSLEHASAAQWSALCRLIVRIQSARRRGVDVRLARPSPSIRLLLSTLGVEDDSWIV